MSSPQEETLTSYNNNIDTYIANTITAPSSFLKTRIDKTLAGMPQETKILEVGTGGSRDADYIESLGYKIIRSDAAESFITYNRENGKTIMKYNALTDELAEKYDLIFADAVLLHFTHEQCETLLRHRAQHINTYGRISRCAQEGSGYEAKENKGMKRHFYYRSEDEIREVMKKGGYKNIETRIDETEPGKKRIRCIASL